MSETISVVAAKPGDVLAESLYDAESKLLLREGVEITESVLALLMRRGRKYVEIESSGDTDSNNQCTCGRAVELKRPDEVDRPVRTWACKGCGGIYFGVEPTSDSDVAPVDVMMEPTKVVDLPDKIERDFANSIAPDEHGAKLRKHERHTVSLPATIVPLDEDYKIAGDAIQLRTHDISNGGVCLKHVQPVTFPYLYVDFKLSGRRSVRMLAEVVRCNQRAGAYEVGCKYISRVISHSGEKECSVPGCRGAAGSEVYRVNLYLPEGDLFYERDDTCPYLCRAHLVENEQLAQGERKPRGITTYPHTNQRRQQGFCIYKPLESE